GVYTPEARKLARLMVCGGVSQANVGKLLKTIAGGLGIRVDRVMSRRTVRRAIHEAGIAAEVQMAYEMEKSENVTISQDSTSNRNINYEAKHINMRVPDYKAGKTVPTATSKPKSRLVGVHSTLDHSSKGSVMSWEQTVTHHMARARTSPLGQRTGMKADLRLFYKWLKGIHGDH
ncbi:hypothetical protein CPB85DRAFT_1174456, partial [Mucidula mucida]